MPHRCTFAVDEVLIVDVKRQPGLPVEQFGEALEHCRISLQLLFPRPDVDRSVPQRRNTGLGFFPRKISGGIFFVHANRAVRLDVDQALDGGLITPVRL